MKKGSSDYPQKHMRIRWASSRSLLTLPLLPPACTTEPLVYMHICVNRFQTKTVKK